MVRLQGLINRVLVLCALVRVATLQTCHFDTFHFDILYTDPVFHEGMHGKMMLRVQISAHQPERYALQDLLAHWA